MKPKIKSVAKNDPKANTPKAGKKFLKRITTKKNWDDLVIHLDETSGKQLNNISTWIRNIITSDNNIERIKIYNMASKFYSSVHGELAKNLPLNC